jgi:tyrosyl-tRNA synthetase
LGLGSLQERFDLIRSVGEECQTEEELLTLLKTNQDFVLYDGFEPSGRMHIAQGVFKAINVGKCTKAGGIFKFWVADWFALMNDKMGGDLEKIKTVGEYLIVLEGCGYGYVPREVPLVLRRDHR